MTYKRIFTILFTGLISICSLIAQEVQRPAVWGIAKMTFLVSDMEMAREYYGRFLGFDEAFSYPSPSGTVVSFKINDRQFLEFIVDKTGKRKKTPRFYITGNRVGTGYVTLLESARSESFSMYHGWGRKRSHCHARCSWEQCRIYQSESDGLHRKSKGKFLSENRISKRIHHAGLYAEKIDEQDPFWVKILKCKEIVRYPLDKIQPGIIQYLGLGDCTENIEHYSPCDENFSHPCFLVEDMQETIYTLKERRNGQTVNRPSIGKTKRWLLNLQTPDKTRVEFTEAYCIK